jgi:predicted transcriptional regulator
MLKRLFTSNTRIKLLTVFLSNEDEEYFIRELTRKLNEQINSIRRELDNLKKMGFLKAKVKNRKKYYYVNKNFIILNELRGIIKKVTSDEKSITQDIEKMGDIKLLVLSGLFIKKETTTIDMLIVGKIDKDSLANYLNTELKPERPVKFAIMTEEDYKYRITCHDKFMHDITEDKENQITIKKLNL